MSDANKTVPGRAETEKLRTQAETGGGRSMARPGNVAGVAGPLPGGLASATPPLGGGIGSGGLRGGAGESVNATSGMSGGETNDAMPGGGATGDRGQPDSVPSDH